MAELAALSLAVYGASLSTWNLVARRRERRESLTRDVLVTGDAKPDPSDPRHPLFRIRAANVGQRPVEIVAAGVVMTNGFSVFHGPETAGLPAWLNDGQSVTVILEKEWLEMAEAMTDQKIAGLAVRDSTGNMHFSNEAASVNTSQSSDPE